ncbi:MAG: hypothetical protein M1836_007714 [Candelina mexicana]|nr:MAG: hypothetical protein M1836_007714 [Candelina mexicana]
MRSVGEIIRPAVSSDVFTFTAGPTPTFWLSFSRPILYEPLTYTCRQERFKRCRPLADVDGEGSEKVRKKKRRLRLILCTSRLSQPYAVPPTHIVDRGPSKIAVWAKQKALGKSMLRKAAIMNCIKKAAIARETEQRELEAAQRAYLPKPVVAQLPRRPYVPLPPSPLGLSNYDALDMEDELHDDLEDDFDSGNDGAAITPVHHDFHMIEPSESLMDNLDGVPHSPQPPSPPDEKVIDLLREQERQKELSFVHFD